MRTLQILYSSVTLTPPSSSAIQAAEIKIGGIFEKTNKITFGMFSACVECGIPREYSLYPQAGTFNAVYT